MDSLSRERDALLDATVIIQNEIEEMQNEPLLNQVKNLIQKIKISFDNANVRINKQDETILRLQQEVSQLKEEVNNLKGPLAGSQITWMWETCLARFVLPPKEQLNKFSSKYEQMIEYAKNDRKAFYRLNRIKGVLKIKETDKLYSLAKSIRDARNSIAHLFVIDLDKAKENLMDNASSHEQQYIKEMIEMLQLAASVMKFGTLADDYLLNQRRLPRLSFSKKEYDAAKMMANWKRDFQQIKNGLQCMEQAHAELHLKKFVDRSMYRPCCNVLQQLKKVNNQRLANLAFEFEYEVLCRVGKRQVFPSIQEIEKDSPEWKKLKKITKDKIWSHEHSDALAEMKDLLLPNIDYRKVDIPNIETAKCLVPDFLEKCHWKCALDILDWYGKIMTTTRASRKRKSSFAGPSFPKRPKRS